MLGPVLLGYSVLPLLLLALPVPWGHAGLAVGVGWLLLAVVLAKRCGPLPLMRWLALWPPPALRRLGQQTVGLLLAQAAVVVAATLLQSALGLDDTLSRWLAPQPGPYPWLTLVVVVVLAPLVEECVFRGWVLSWLLVLVQTRWLAVAVAAMLFTGLHAQYWDTPMALVYVGSLAILYGAWRLRSDSLWPVVLGHGLNNALALALAWTG